MKRTKQLLLSLLLILTLLLGACGDGEIKQNDNSSEINQSAVTTIIDDDSADDADYAAENNDKLNESSNENSDKQSAGSGIVSADTPANDNQNYQNIKNKDTAEKTNQAFSLANVPAYNGKAYVAVNNNEPYFTPADYSTKSFERYSSLDTLGRCGVAFANVGQDIMPTEDRGDISSVTPSGWKNKNYGDLVDGGYLYNRCHLLGFQLTGENANEKNLITGTRYLNIEGMLPFENMIADYVKETNNHVLYRVTPIFEGSNLLASGVLLEGYSVEDEGEGISFCVYCYNVQPGIALDYATGESSAEGASEEDKVEPSSQSTDKPTTTALAPAPQPKPTPDPTTPTITSVEEPAQTVDYILNTNTHKFHYPDCSSVNSMNESNKEYFSGSRDEIIARGYASCGRCKP